MARAPRIEFAGAIYHVMNRGNHLEQVFEGDGDRTLFLKTLEETCFSAGWVVHSFALMNNHYHLLIETSRPTLVKGMQYLDSTYTQRYNSRHQTRGHLFQGRYKALLVDGDGGGYFLTVSDYIHLNPARVKGVTRIRELEELLKSPWSSAGWLAGKQRKRPEWLRWERVYGELGLANWKSRSRQVFRTYLDGRLREVRGDDESWRLIRRGWCLGSEGFVAQMKEKLADLATKPRDAESWAGEAVEELEKERAERLLVVGMKRLGYEQTEEVKGMDRYLLARWIRSQTKVSVKWLSQRFGVETRGGMSHGIYLLNQRLPENRSIQKRSNLLTR